MKEREKGWEERVRNKLGHLIGFLLTLYAIFGQQMGTCWFRPTWRDFSIVPCKRFLHIPPWRAKILSHPSPIHSPPSPPNPFQSPNSLEGGQMFKQTLFSFHRNAVNLYRRAAGFSGLTLRPIKPSKIFLSSKLLFGQDRLVKLLHTFQFICLLARWL